MQLKPNNLHLPVDIIPANLRSRLHYVQHHRLDRQIVAKSDTYHHRTALVGFRRD